MKVPTVLLLKGRDTVFMSIFFWFLFISESPRRHLRSTGVREPLALSDIPFPGRRKQDNVKS